MSIISLKENIVYSEALIEAVLNQIENELCKVMWNNTQEEYPSPFDNTGNRYKNDTFEVRAFDWSDDPEVDWNFKYKDIEISWCKYLGRGMDWNRPITLEELQEMLEDCLASIRKEDKLLYYFEKI
jgi:hypothetical protein